MKKSLGFGMNVKHVRSVSFLHDARMGATTWLAVVGATSAPCVEGHSVRGQQDVAVMNIIYMNPEGEAS
jgi:hypothetical protein